MQIIKDKKEYQKIWDVICSDYAFFPSTDSGKTWLNPNGVFQRYRLLKKWDEHREASINRILCEVVAGEMFALDWQHDCFSFDPSEKIPTGYTYYDRERDCSVYFPEYYPDGDYHFFVSKDWRFGLFGHPWRKELIVVGEELIVEIDKKLKELNLEILNDVFQKENHEHELQDR